MSDFVMPALGADMESGTLLQWYVKSGDAVKRGDIVALVDTNKAEIEVEIFEDGIIDELVVAEGQRVPVGTVLATLRPAGVEAAAAVPPKRRGAVAPAEAAPRAPTEVRAVAAPAAAHNGHRLRISPVARRAAEQLGVDVSALAGTGPEGAITKADVEQAASRASAPRVMPPPAATVRQPDRQAAMREAIAGLMARSKREIPHYYLQTEIDLTRALDWLHETNLQRPLQRRLLSSILLLAAVARAAAATPQLNGFWIDGAFRASGAVHLGVAISLRGGGLIAPALHDADRLTVDEIMAGVADLVTRARAGRLRGSEMSDPTITVTNLGEHSVDLVHGVIYPPQVALVGFGGIRERPWTAGGMVGARPTVMVSLAADHRASDGHTAARLLTLIDDKLQEPEEL